MVGWWIVYIIEQVFVILHLLLISFVRPIPSLRHHIQIQTTFQC